MIRSSRAISLPSTRPSAQARLALLTGGALLASMSLSSLGLAMARADEQSDRKSRQYKIGAAVLGGAAVYFGLKKKNPVAAAAAGAGAYYAYKKGKEAKEQSQRERYGQGYGYPGDTTASYPDDDVYASNPRDYPADVPVYDDGNGAYADDYGTPVDNDYPASTPGGGYVRNGEYPDYGVNGLRARRSARSNRGATNATQRQSRRVVVK